MVISLLLAVPLFDLNLFEPDTSLDFTNPANIPVLKFMQIIHTISLFLLPALFSGYVFYTGNKGTFGLHLRKAPNATTLFTAALCMIVSLPLINALAELNSHLSLPESLSWLEQKIAESEKNAEALTQAFLSVNTTGALLVNIIMIAVFPALGEEFLFRGIIQRILHEWTKNIHVAIFITGFFFSALHMQFYGFLPRMLMGVYFGYLLYWSKNIWIPVAAHFVNNASAVVVYYFYYQGKITSDIDKLGTNTETSVFFFSGLLLTSLLVWIIRKKEIGKSK